MPRKTSKTHYVMLRLKFTEEHTPKDAFLAARRALNKTRHYIGGVRVLAAKDNGSFTVDRTVPCLGSN